MAQSAALRHPLRTHVQTFIDHVNTGTLDDIKTYIQSSFTPEFLKAFPIEEHTQFILSLRENSKTLDIHRIDEVEPNHVKVFLQSSFTEGWYCLEIWFDPEADHKISNLFILPTQSLEAPKRKIQREDIAETLETFTQKLVDADLFSGTVLLAYKDEVIVQEAYGFANKDFDVPNTLETKFNLGSMNKMFTGVAITQLAERGELSFEDSLAKFLPDFPNPISSKKIKIKHLLTHTSGLGRFFSEKFWKASRDLYRTIDDMMTLVEDEALLFEEPGTRWEYSNTGMLVLGKVIECVTGESYFKFIQDNIYAPAGMHNSGSFELDKVNQNLAVGYHKIFTSEGTTLQNNLFQHVIRGGSHGGGFSTAHDILRFANHLRSHTFLSEDNTNLVLSPKPDLNSPDYGYGFGLNFGLWLGYDTPIVGHGGGFPGVGTTLDMFLGTPWNAIVLSNYSFAMKPIALKIIELLEAAGEIKRKGSIN